MHEFQYAIACAMALCYHPRRMHTTKRCMMPFTYRRGRANVLEAFLTHGTCASVCAGVRACVQSRDNARQPMNCVYTSFKHLPSVGYCAKCAQSLCALMTLSAQCVKCFKLSHCHKRPMYCIVLISPQEMYA